MNLAGWQVGLILAVTVACWQCNAGEGTSALPSEQAEHSGHATHQDHSEHAGHTITGDAFDLAEVTDSPNRLVLSNQKTVSVTGTIGATPLTLTGYVAIDPRRSRNVATRVGGRIDKLYVRYAYQFVRKGDKLLDLYSPDLSTYQDEYKYLLRTGSDSMLLESSRTKLRLLGLSDNQIRQLANTDRPILTVSVYSPYTGYVLLEEAQTTAQPTMPAPTDRKEGMNNMPQPSGSPVYTRLSGRLTEGRYVNAGETLFIINDLRTVWGILLVAPTQQALIQINQLLALNSELAPDAPIHTRIQYVEPVYQAGQKSVSVRTYLPNADGRLKLNSLLTGHIRPAVTDRHWIPFSSVYDLGNRKIVWVVRGQTAGGKKQFEARQVVTGRIAGDQVEVKKGLSAGEEIALDAGYLTDSESLISLPQLP